MIWPPVDYALIAFMRRPPSVLRRVGVFSQADIRIGLPVSAGGHTLRPQEVTVAEAVKSVGYTTGHFGKWHLGSVQANSPVSPGNSGFDEWVSSPNFYENDPWMSHNGVVEQLEGESSRVTVDAALDFIKQADKNKKPFLAVIWFGNPHTPHEAVPELKALYSNQDASFQNYFGEITGVDRAMGICDDS